MSPLAKPAQLRVEDRIELQFDIEQFGDAGLLVEWKQCKDLPPSVDADPPFLALERPRPPWPDHSSVGGVVDLIDQEADGDCRNNRHYRRNVLSYGLTDG